MLIVIEPGGDGLIGGRSLDGNGFIHSLNEEIQSFSIFQWDLVVLLGHWVDPLDAVMMGIDHDEARPCLARFLNDIGDIAVSHKGLVNKQLVNLWVGHYLNLMVVQQVN